MKQLVQHILEKLKVSSDTEYLMTYGEFYDLLKSYIDKDTFYMFDVGKVFKFNDDDLPKYSNDKTRVIQFLQPSKGSGDKKDLIIHTVDFYTMSNKRYFPIDCIKNADEIINFTEENKLAAIIEYLQNRLK
jgi:hypothetical protein